MAEDWWSFDGGLGSGGTDYSLDGDSGNWSDNTAPYAGSFINNDSFGFPMASQIPFSQPMASPGMGGGFGQGINAYGSIAQGALGFGGGLAALIGQIMGRNQGSSPQYMNNAQRGGMQSASAQLGNFAQGKNPTQQMQMDLLKAITGGQGLNQNYAKGIEQAFEPQLGALYNQASRAGQARGFHDAPATSPAGGAILGPGLADLQGQIAQAKLAMMMGLPGLFNTPINQQFQGAMGQANLFSGMPYGQQRQQSIGPIIGQGIGNALQGVGQAMGQGDQQAAQLDFQNRFLQALQQRPMGGQVPQGPQENPSGFSFSSYMPNTTLQGPKWPSEE